MKGNSAHPVKNICVFCGSNLRKNAKFVEIENNLGRVLAKRKIHLVCKGSSLGLMGCVSTAAHVKGRQVLGIIPTAKAEGNFAEKQLGRNSESQPCRTGYEKCLTILIPLLPYQVVLVLWKKTFKSPLGLN
ncbi:hypothetical protein DITRI_Ditri10aG0083000 [Diplodiscus trichospermus]